MIDAQYLRTHEGILKSNVFRHRRPVSRKERVASSARAKPQEYSLILNLLWLPGKYKLLSLFLNGRFATIAACFIKARGSIAVKLTDTDTAATAMLAERGLVNNERSLYLRQPALHEPRSHRFLFPKRIFIRHWALFKISLAPTDALPEKCAVTIA